MPHNSGVPEGGGRRALAWRLLLGYLPGKRKHWAEVTREKRALYTQLIQEMIVTGPEDKSPELEDHPLNPNPTSQWQSFFKDNEVKFSAVLCVVISDFESVFIS